MKPIKAYKTYQGSLDGERHREKQWRSTKQGAFESSFVSFEETTEKYYPLSKRILNSIESDREKIRQAYKAAHQTVSRKKRHCRMVFKLILKNGNARQKSILELVMRDKRKRTYAVLENLYYRHREELLTLFIC